MSRSFLLLVAVSLLMAMAIPAAAGGPPDKATGSGYWTSSGGAGPVYYGEFNAHEELGRRPAKGYLLQERVDGWGGFTVDVTDVLVGDGYACFGGLVDAAWGGFDGFQGWYRWTYVVDGGEPGIGVDSFRGNWSADWDGIPRPCKTGTLTSKNLFTDGNVQVHFRSSGA